MNNFIDAMLSNDTLTENGALTHSTSNSCVLDLFFIAGACRNVDVSEIEQMLVRSYDENKVKTLKIIFWAGDIREGAGERRFFSIALSWLYKNHKEDLYTYLKYIQEFSRWDVLFQFKNDDTIINYIIDNFKLGNPLLCKWLPRRAVNKSEYKRILKYNIPVAGMVNLRDELPKANSVSSYTGYMVGKDLYVSIKSEWKQVFIDKNKNKYYMHSTTNDVKEKFALILRDKLGWSPKKYRKHLVKHTNVVEQKMCAKKWSEIEYEHVPSVAINKYNKAWYRNDESRFKEYLESVKKGEKKINASAIFPHDILKQAINSYDTELNEAKVVQWNNLPNYLGDTVNSMIPVCDVSDSMTCNNCLPIDISISLGLYISERNVGPFKDAFITFSNSPKLMYLKGDIRDRINQMKKIGWLSENTNIYLVFQLILQKAVQYKLSNDELPKKVLIISDMEFDACATGNNYEAIKLAYEKYGYMVPQIVFWNVNGRPGNVPIKMHDANTALISGASPSIIKSVLSNDIDPIKVMNRAIEVERYGFIQ